MVAVVVVVVALLVLGDNNRKQIADVSLVGAGVRSTGLPGLLASVLAAWLPGWRRASRHLEMLSSVALTTNIDQKY